MLALAESRTPGLPMVSDNHGAAAHGFNAVPVEATSTCSQLLSIMEKIIKSNKKATGGPDSPGSSHGVWAAFPWECSEQGVAETFPMGAGLGCGRAMKGVNGQQREFRMH
jgi:hypothetical protein